MIEVIGWNENAVAFRDFILLDHFLIEIGEFSELGQEKVHWRDVLLFAEFEQAAFSLAFVIDGSNQILPDVAFLSIHMSDHPQLQSTGDRAHDLLRLLVVGLVDQECSLE